MHPDNPSSTAPQVDLQSIMILPYAVDEWYGIMIQFHWQEKLHPSWPDQGKDAATGEKRLMLTAFEHIRDSTAWAQFYSQAPKVTIIRDSGGDDDEQQVNVSLPQFTTQDASNQSEWEFSREGGSILISRR